jgi:toxin CptA
LTGNAAYIGRIRSRAVLIIDPRPSRLLLISGGIGHLLAGVAVIVCSLPLWVKAGFIAGIGLALVRFGLQYGRRRGRGFVARLELLDGVWRLETGDGTLHRAWLTGGYAHPGIVILNFRLETGGRRSLALLPDAAEAEALRRLRVWLRTRRDADEPDPP